MPKKTEPSSRGGAKRRAPTVEELESADHFEDEEMVDSPELDLDVQKVLADYQKKKATKASSRAATFIRQKNALFTSTRNDMTALAQDGQEMLLGTIETARRVRAEAPLYENATGIKRVEEAVGDADSAILETFLKDYREDLRTLSRRRAHQIESASATLESLESRQKSALRSITKDAKDYITEGVELKNVAVDASNFIKHFKSLLLS